MRYVSAKDVLVIHARIVEKTGGSQGVCDVGMLESAVAAPQKSFEGKDLYQGVFTKAAVLFKKLASNHPFVDGNKRTAFTMSARFLFMNGYTIEADETAVVNFTVRIVEKNLDIDQIADWLSKNAKRKN